MPEPFRKKVNLPANTPTTLIEAAAAAGYQGNALADEYRIITTDADIYIDTTKTAVSSTVSDKLAAGGATDTERAAQSKIDLNKIVLLSAANTAFYLRIRP